MKKNVVFGTVAALFLGAGIFTSVNLTQKPKMSNLTLANIEALTGIRDLAEKTPCHSSLSGSGQSTSCSTCALATGTPGKNSITSECTRNR